MTKSKAKILLLDIETAPALSYHWGMYDQNIGTNQVKHDWYMLCWSAKWLGKKKIMFDAINNYKDFKKDPQHDGNITSTLWDLLNEADIVIAHHGDSFDVKKIQSCFLKHGMEPPSPFRTVDTKKAANKYFGFMSNKLDHILRRLELGHKLEHQGFGLWLGCMAGDRKSWKRMRQYNIRDVVGLEKVYKAMLPFIANHPHVGVYSGDREVCPNCGSTRSQRRGVSVTNAQRYPRHQCQDCGRWWRGKRCITDGS